MASYASRETRRHYGVGRHKLSMAATNVEGNGDAGGFYHDFSFIYLSEYTAHQLMRSWYS